MRLPSLSSKLGSSLHFVSLRISLFLLENNNNNMKKSGIIFCVGLAVMLLNSCADKNPTYKLSSEEFKKSPSGTGVHTWWHWLDGAITKEGITKDLEAMNQQGIVQATILNVGLFNGKDFGVKQVKFDSPEWHEMFLWALEEAKRLGISLGAHNCDGWSTSGGPWITPEFSMKQFVWSKTYVSGADNSAIQLPKPHSERDFYRDVAVVAYKSKQSTSSFQLAKPVCRINSIIETKSLFDGDPSSAIRMNKGDKISFQFEDEFKASQILIHPRKSFTWNDTRNFISGYRLTASRDGKNYRKIAEFEIKGLNQSVSIEFPLTTEKYYQLEIIDIANIDSYIGFTISEIELLMPGEKPLFNSTVPNLLEKVVSVKASDRLKFESSGSPDSSLVIPENEIINLTDKMDENGNLLWNVPEGNWSILRFGYTTTAATNGPATAEGTGLECDKMDTAALNVHFKNFPQKLIDNAGQYAGNTFKFILIDSWECGYQNWTGNFPSEFEKNRGYSIINWIPALCGETVGSADMTDAFLYDFRKTIADLVENNYYRHFRDLCHAGKIEMHAEIIYGDANYPPLEIIRTNSYVDLPMFEFWAGHNSNTFVEYTPSKPFESFPVFAAAGYNIPVVGSEAYTGMAHYSESFQDLKSFGDRAFCSGINQMILHSYVHQPFDKRPGMTLGPFSAHFNRNNAYWQHASEWLNYQTRVQNILQKGTIASNILYYIGDQLPQYLDNPVVNELPFGYRAMACNADMLKNNAIVKDGKIVMNNGTEYGLLILPDTDAMEFGTLQIIAELVKKGANVLGPKPVKPYSMIDLNKNMAGFNEIANNLWGGIDGKSIHESTWGKGKVFAGLDILEVLNMSGIKPEFFTGSEDYQKLIYIHKKYGTYDIYFVVNQLDESISRECIFAVGIKTPQIWDPMDGSIRLPAVFSSENGLVRIPLSFKPKESMFFVFEDRKPENFISKVFSGEEQIFPSPDSASIWRPVPFVSSEGKEFVYSADSDDTYTFITSKGKEITKEIRKEQIHEITINEGEIIFVPGYVAEIPPVKFSSLKPLTEYEELPVKYFSGNAAYTISFSTPAEIFESGDPLFLDIGKYESTAIIALNGKYLGISWMPGTRFDVTELLQKENTLEIVTTIIYRNRIIGDFIESGELKNIWTSAPVEQFLDKEKPLKPSGLIGPVRIIQKRNIR